MGTPKKINTVSNPKPIYIFCVYFLWTSACRLAESFLWTFIGCFYAHASVGALVVNGPR